MSILERVAGIAGILAAVLAIAGILLALIMSPWFDWTTDALSNLGEQGQPSAPFFNLGLIIGGILALVFIVGLFKTMEHSVGRIGALVFAAASLALIGVGVFSLPHHLHSFAAVIFFILLPISLFLVWIDLRKGGKSKLVRGTLIAGSITASFAIITIVFSLLSLGIAIPEFIFALTAMVWMFVYGIELIRKP